MHSEKSQTAKCSLAFITTVKGEFILSLNLAHTNAQMMIKILQNHRHH